MSAPLLFLGGLFAITYLFLGFLAAKNPLLARLAIREAVRRKGQTVLVVGGLMVGAAGITASLVGTDSANDSALLNAYRAWGMTDLTVAAQADQPFPAGVTAQLSNDPALRPYVDGVQAGLETVASVADLDRKQGESGVRLIGFDPATQQPFGPYLLTDGRRTFGGDLGADGVLLSHQLSTALDAQTGDLLRITVEQTAGTSVDVRVAGIARSEGPGAYGLYTSVFLPLPLAQKIAGTTDINVVRISAVGGLESGQQGAVRAFEPLKAAVAASSGSDTPLAVQQVKAAEVKAAKQNTQFTFAMLSAMSILVLAAGVALVVNLVMMLAEERRSRLAVLRAMGLTRRGLITLSVLEGAFYSLAAAAVGTTVGLFAGKVLAARFGKAFAEFFGAAVDYRFKFALHPKTLAIAFCAGALITLVTLFFASRRTSRMSIPAAIRNLPEPAEARGRRGWSRFAVPATLSVVGVAGLTQGVRFGQLVGGYALIIGVATALKGRLPERLYATLYGGTLAAWSFVMVNAISAETDPNKFFSVFTVAVLVSVLGLVMAASANLRAVETAVGGLGRLAPGLRAILRPPLAYLTRRRTRTALSMSMFAIVMAIISMFSVFLFVFQPQYERDSGGYEIVVTASGGTGLALPDSFAGEIARQTAIPTRGYVGPLSSQFQSLERIFVPLYTLSSFNDPPVHLSSRDGQFASDEAAWAKVQTDPGWVVTNFGQVGGVFTLQGADGPVTMHIAANPATGMFQGVIGSEGTMASFSTAPLGETLLVDVNPGVNAAATARAIERAMFSRGVNAQTTKSILDAGYRANRTFFSVIDVLMRMGLVVGILSLGILALRAVVERRHIIGVLRALGYRRRSVMAGLMIEAGVTTTLGVAVGSLAGLIMGFIFFRSFYTSSSFGIDGITLWSALGLIYGAVVVVTLGPAWRASRLPPAEAVRYLG